MSSQPFAPKGGSLMSRKVGGVPVIYLALAFVAILAVVAYRMKATTAAPATDPNTDPNASTADGSNNVYPSLPIVTQVPAASAPIATPIDTINTNDEWMRKAMQYLMDKGVNPGVAQLALQAYLAGDSLTAEQGKIRDDAVRQYGLPPETFTAGSTAAPVPVRPIIPPRTFTPLPYGPPNVQMNPLPTTPKPVPKPVPPKVRTHIVRSGETLSSIGARYKVTWQKIYNANKRVIGSNPNMIKPGQRLTIPY